MTQVVDLGALARRNRELEDEVRYYRRLLSHRVNLYASLGLTAKQSLLAELIRLRGPILLRELCDVYYATTDDPPEFAEKVLGVMIWRMRQRLRVHGLLVSSRPWYGYWISDEVKGKLEVARRGTP